jgi:hypothetical protein
VATQGQAPGRDERTLGDLLKELTGEIRDLFRKEVELARTEITSTAIRTGKNASLIGVGAAVVYGGFLALVIAAIALLVTLGLAAWVAALIVGVVLLAAGYLLIQRGRSQLEAGSLAPTRTIETLKDDAELMRGRTR